MTQAAHTPGPWYYVDSIETGEFFGCGVSETEGGPEFIWFDDARDPERDIANARLIAAAPDLLEALVVAEREFEGIRHTLINLLEDPESSAFWSAVAARDVVRAAIAKAKGGDK